MSVDSFESLSTNCAVLKVIVSTGVYGGQRTAGV